MVSSVQLMFGSYDQHAKLYTFMMRPLCSVRVGYVFCGETHSVSQRKRGGSISDFFFGLFSLRFLLFSTWLCSFSDISCTTMTVATLFSFTGQSRPCPLKLDAQF